ncbi:DUF6233 domain-containing protein [Streptomyces sp. NPDC026206]|uniref:DUF6233 domain-containing protein n=1 Tax=Streptomyces sp. NPDC026206 TaxID=3157089 RepID=UPI0033E48050
MRARTGRRPSTPLAAQRKAGARWPRVHGDGTARWKVERPRDAYTAAERGRSVVHHASCFVAGGGPAELTAAQALEALRHPGAVPCDVGGADRRVTTC